jgi:hypothetical protein|tara:strand:+ start:253 stop:369 length:117 start_codon:yes stop_codon:yes gene_type:complete
MTFIYKIGHRFKKEAGQIPALSRSGRPWEAKGESDQPP